MPPVAKHVVDHQDALSRVDGVAMDLQLVAAVLERVLLAHHCPGQLAGLAHGDETGTHPVRDRSSDDETASLHPEHSISLHVVEAARQLGDGPTEPRAIAQERRDVAKAHTRRREVVDVANQFGEPVAV